MTDYLEKSVPGTQGALTEAGQEQKEASEKAICRTV